MKLEELLREMVDAKASDIFIIAGLPLSYEVSGRQIRLDSAPLMPDDTETFVRAIYEVSGRSMKSFVDNGNHDDDFSFAIAGVGRFRSNVFRQRGSFGAVIRVIPFGLPNPADFHIPDEVLRLARLQKGLVLVTGPAGAGKSTTLACIIDKLNHERSGHIITMEDPIEYVHKHGSCIVTQREVPTDIATYGEALRSAMRESPDVILLGEMRDYETISAAVTAAETGHLVMSTLHTIGAAQTIDRIIDVCPPGAQSQIRGQLSTVLRGVITQQLLPLATGRGRCAATEILVGSDAVCNLIRENKCFQIPSVLQSGAALGMHSLNGDLARLVDCGKITREAALRCSTDKKDLEQYF